jgi:hypothetical protein
VRGLALLAILVGIAGLAFAVSMIPSSGLPELFSGAPSKQHRTRDDRRSEEPIVPPEVTARLEDARDTVWRIGGVALAGIAGLALLLVPLRLRARSVRRYVRLRLLPYRADEAEPLEIVRLFEIWHQQLLQRWWRRLASGQPSLALELVMRPAEGDPTCELSVVCPERLVAAVEGGLLGCYPDSRLVRDDRPLPYLRHVLRLKKRFGFVRALRPLEDENRRPVDSVLSNMESLARPALVQYVFTPTPALFDRWARARFGAVEHHSESARALDPGQPGLRSEVLAQELQGGLRVQHHALYFTEVRVAAESRAHGMAIAGVLRGETAAENRLVVRHMRAWGRRPLYLRRIEDGVGNPLPGWRRGVLSSAEIAGLWQLPSPGLKVVRLERSSLPRMPAPPEVSRDPGDALMMDERGRVGIRPTDKTDGLGLIGGQKTGKTAVLCRTVQADALDPNCALIVLMPKPGDALKALSMIPARRTVHYLDLERPGFGINPLRAEGDPAMVADKIVDAFRDIHVEGDIRGSSDRYLRQAAQAAIGASRCGVVDRAPTLWDMYRMLIPAERAFRERVVESLYADSRYTDTVTFFGRELPSDLESAPAQTTAKLDAPRNKVLRLLVESLDKVLRHPIQIDLDEVVRRREVLIVDGKMGTFGADNCRVMMQFILSALYGALRRQQELPEGERPRVALKVDEAHLVLNESFADAMATLRSGGLEVVAAWQYGEQIQDPKIRSGMMSLLRQRCMFSMGESQDARELANIAMAVYADMIRADPESRSRMRVTPDAIFNLPNHHAICSWISRGARVPAFVAQTVPLETDDDIIGHHMERQRDRGCHLPDRLSDPLPDLDWTGPHELPSRDVARGGDQVADSNGDVPGSGPPRRHALGSNGHDPGAKNGNGAVEAADLALRFDPSASSVDTSLERPASTPPDRVPDSYTELDLDDVRNLVWEKVTPVAADRVHEPTGRELEILAALWSYRFLFPSQIWRRWWRGSSLRAAQQALNKMAKAGWVRRFKLQTGERGAQPRVYVITRLGFELAQGKLGRRGPYIDPEAGWREAVMGDPRRILRSLHINGWVLAFETRAGKALRAWRGPRESTLEPPRRRVRGQWIELRPEDVLVGSSHKLRDYGSHSFEPLTPDATIELRIAVGDSPLQLDLLVEYDRSRSATASEDRLRRYDGLISGWSGMLDRYKTLGTPPVAVFVCEDERRALALLRAADKAVTARLAKPGTEETEWPHPGRRAIFFAAERDIHTGSLEAFQLPEQPPEVRVRLHGRKAAPCHARRVHIIEPRLLDVA